MNDTGSDQLKSRARELLRTRFGFDDFRRQQAAAVGHLLAGNDVLVVMPTGGGKSLCYQFAEPGA